MLIYPKFIDKITCAILIDRLSVRWNLLYILNPLPANRRKIEALRSSGALNRNPENVRHSLFAEHGFFDTHDLVQLIYETVRVMVLDDRPFAHASCALGLSGQRI